MKILKSVKRYYHIVMSMFEEIPEIKTPFWLLLSLIVISIFYRIFIEALVMKDYIIISLFIISNIIVGITFLLYNSHSKTWIIMFFVGGPLLIVYIFAYLYKSYQDVNSIYSSLTSNEHHRYN